MEAGRRAPHGGVRPRRDDAIFSFLLGPDQIPEPRCAAATFSLLPVTGLAGSFRESGGHSLRLVFAGAKANPSHHHSDKGGFVAEVDGETVFPDRGQVRYDTGEHLTDCELRKVYRLRLWSPPLREFALVTRFQRL